MPTVRTRGNDSRSLKPRQLPDASIDARVLALNVLSMCCGPLTAPACSVAVDCLLVAECSTC